MGSSCTVSFGKSLLFNVFSRKKEHLFSNCLFETFLFKFTSTFKMTPNSQLEDGRATWLYEPLQGGGSRSLWGASPQTPETGGQETFSHLTPTWIKEGPCSGGRKARLGLPQVGLCAPERAEWHEEATLQHTPLSSYSPILLTNPLLPKLQDSNATWIASLGKCRKTIGAREEEAAAS